MECAAITAEQQQELKNPHPWALNGSLLGVTYRQHHCCTGGVFMVFGSWGTHSSPVATGIKRRHGSTVSGSDCVRVFHISPLKTTFLPETASATASKNTPYFPPLRAHLGNARQRMRRDLFRIPAYAFFLYRHRHWGHSNGLQVLIGPRLFRVSVWHEQSKGL